MDAHNTDLLNIVQLSVEKKLPLETRGSEAICV